MTKFAVKHSGPVLIPVRGSEKQFPVNMVYCVGRNYAAHSREMGTDERQPPLFFSKPGWTVNAAGSNIPYPSSTSDLQHEIELVLAMGSEQNIYGFAVGVDLTRRDLQARAKKEGRPWFSAKVFTGAAPVSKIIPTDNNFDFSNLMLELTVNGEVRQSASCRDMIWSPADIVRNLAGEAQVKSGDLIFTGTPAGVSTIKKEDKIHAEINDVVGLDFTII